jgi:cyclopropane fatty-acyl-phospholipid synthase-like methyltransferase
MPSKPGASRKKNQIIAALESVAKLSPGARALDIGTGSGACAIYLAQKGFVVEALDKDRANLRRGRKEAQMLGLRIKWHLRDVRNFPFVPEKYDLVTALFCLDYLKPSDIKKTLAKIRTSLKTGGVFLLAVFSSRDYTFRLCQQYGMKRVSPRTFRSADRNSYRHFFTRGELKKFLQGFKVLKLKEKKMEFFSPQSHQHRIIMTITKKREA